MLRAIIIDDELSGIETLKILAGRYPELVRIVATTTDPEEGIMHIANYDPDVVFLDISMPGMSGFEMLKRLPRKDFKLVFTTAHREYAIEAIKNKAADYLLKPIDHNELRKCLEDMTASSVSPQAPAMGQHQYIDISTSEGIILIKQREIVRVEAARSYTIFYMDGGRKQVASRSMKEYEGQLDPALFFRCHNSHIVNLEKVERITPDHLAVLSDGSQVDIAKKSKTDLLYRLKAM